MTIETKMTAEIRDIRAVEFECPDCRARISIPLTQNNYPPFKCKNGTCSKVFFADSSLEWNELRNTLGVLGKYAKADNLPCAIRLELTMPPSKEITK
jgi:hypothetical protein